MASSGVDVFSENTKRTIQARAGSVCSNPECKARTSGPSETVSDKAVNVGEAAHIAGNARGSARFDPNMTSEQRRSPRNGIWLCSTCADLIDKNGGADHSVELLHKWKSDRERQAANEIGKPAEQIPILDGTFEASGVGTVTGADIRAPVIFRPGSIFRASGSGNITAVKVEKK